MSLMRSRLRSASDEDLRVAIATCLLEHLLEQHFDLLFPQMEIAVREDSLFARALGMCWKFGQAGEPSRARRMGQLLSALRR